MTSRFVASDDESVEGWPISCHGSVKGSFRVAVTGVCMPQAQYF